jgi:hypothetical protein
MIRIVRQTVIRLPGRRQSAPHDPMQVALQSEGWAECV